MEATFQYDAANRLTRRMSTNDAPVTFGYDAVGNRIEAVDGTGRSTFTYHLLNRRTGAVDPGGHAITFSYDSAARRTLTELANGTRTSYTYDAASRVQQLYNLKADGSMILGLTYEHDAVGNPTTMLESTGDRVTWTYDAADRLTREQRSGESAYDNTYTYDPLGNRLLKDASNARTTYGYDLANQLTTSQDAVGVTTYTYDLAGNLQIAEQPTGQRTTTTWDDQNRQTGVLLPDGSAVTNTFGFDGLRYSKQEPQATTKFLWDVNNYLAETDAADEIQAIYTNEPQAYGNLISQYRKGPTIWLPSYYHDDALGSTRALTDASAQITDSYVYDAWGNEVVATGTTLNPFRWVGRVGYYWDEELGMLYIRARVYDPVTGRWLSQDSLFYPVINRSADLANGLVQMMNCAALNVYAYVCAVPTTEIDPSGQAGIPGIPLAGYYQAVCVAVIRTVKIATWGIAATMVAEGCKLPTLTCKPCCGDHATFNPTTKEITIFSTQVGLANWASQASASLASHFVEVILHEYVHAFDECLRGKTPAYPFTVCSEIRAYSIAGCAPGSISRLPGWSHRECVKWNAYASTIEWVKDRNPGLGELPEEAKVAILKDVERLMLDCYIKEDATAIPAWPNLKPALP